MGEICFPCRVALDELQYWEIRAVIRGYGRRNREMWSAIRWQTFSLMSVFADLKKAGIHRPTDLLEFPWDREAAPPPPPMTAQEVSDLQREMAEENKFLQRQHAEMAEV